jgi:hypothetical protein
MLLGCLFSRVTILDHNNVEPFLKALRRCFNVNRASCVVDPDDALKLSTVSKCFPLGSTARAWFDDVEDDLESYDQFESDFREAFIAGAK